MHPLSTNVAGRARRDQPSSSVVLDHVSFTWPDGTAVLDDVTTSFTAGRTGLVGANGAGKTTLLRLITGELQPTSGHIGVSGAVGYLPQHLVLATATTVSQLLGIEPALAAVRAIERGDTAPEHFDAIGDDWDIEARARALLDSLDLDGIGLDRRVGTLSGGEAVLVGLAGLRLAQSPVVLLDEPTNNLDRVARAHVREQIRTWRGALVVISHDLALLELMDDTAELRAHQVSVFGGPFSQFREAIETEQRAAERGLGSAEARLKVERRQRIEADTKLARRASKGRKDHQRKTAPKIILNARKSAAQASAGKLRGELDDRIEKAQAEVTAQTERIRDDAVIRVDLPVCGVSASRRLAELRDGERTIVLQGPERVALTGRNGVGKTRLVDTLLHPETGDGRPVYGIAHTRRIGLLAQRLDDFDERGSVLDNVRAAAPRVPPGQVRAALARFLFRADEVARPMSSLSGGERFRVALARLLLADPPHQLLILDEPTNNLDLDSVESLVTALSGYTGGLLVISHDDRFLQRIGVTTRVELADDRLTLLR